MKKAQPVVMLSIILALVVMLIVQHKQHEREMQRFRLSVRSITVAARAKDADTGAFLPCHVQMSNSGEDLGITALSCSDQGQQISWVTTKQKTIQVTSPGYSTQSFVIATSRTNVFAQLNKLEKSSNQEIHGTQ